MGGKQNDIFVLFCFFSLDFLINQIGVERETKKHSMWIWVKIGGNFRSQIEAIFIFISI